MVTKTLAYDAPAYHVPIVFSGSTEKVANGVTPKWIAFTAMKLKRVIQAPVLALITTAAGSQPFLYTQSGTTTSTTTTVPETTIPETTTTETTTSTTLPRTTTTATPETLPEPPQSLPNASETPMPSGTTPTTFLSLETIILTSD